MLNKNGIMFDCERLPKECNHNNINWVVSFLPLHGSKNTNKIFETKKAAMEHLNSIELKETRAFWDDRHNGVQAMLFLSWISKK